MQTYVDPLRKIARCLWVCRAIAGPITAACIGTLAGTGWSSTAQAQNYATPLAPFIDDYTKVTTLVAAKQFQEALIKADLYLEGKPKDPQMRFIKGVILTETGQSADALKLFTTLTQDYPELPEPYNNLAVLYAANKQFEQARSALEMAVRTNPSYATAHENLGDVYSQLASQSYRKALQLEPYKTTAQTKLALIRSLLTANP
jgi:tetratricopeptide (TPR) repeat protein